MATSRTHPHIPPHVLHEPQPRSHTPPQPSPPLLPRGVTLHPSSLPDAHNPPKSLQHHSAAPPSLCDQGPTSLPAASNAHHTALTEPFQPSETSVASLENARYRLGEVPHSEHPNEDRHFTLVDGHCRVFGVFDGHDGPRAAGFASNFFIQYFSSDSWKAVTSLPARDQRKQIPMALREFFRAAEQEFFHSIRHPIEERKQLQRTIPSVGCYIGGVYTAFCGVMYIHCWAIFCQRYVTCSCSFTNMHGLLSHYVCLCVCVYWCV